MPFSNPGWWDCDDCAFARLLDAVRKLEDLWTTRKVDMPPAISSPVAAFNAVRDSYLASEWNRILSAHNEEWDRDENDKHRDALVDRLCETSDAIWAKPVHTWEDLIERAAMAVHWNGNDMRVAFPDDVIAGEPDDFDARALAHVARGILDLAGLKFDAEGRLI